KNNDDYYVLDSGSSLQLPELCYRFRCMAFVSRPLFKSFWFTNLQAASEGTRGELHFIEDSTTELRIATNTIATRHSNNWNSNFPTKWQFSNSLPSPFLFSSRSRKVAQS
ncbi:hypothetical protein NPIL_244121, partial [Nephila pilipes]